MNPAAGHSKQIWYHMHNPETYCSGGQQKSQSTPTPENHVVLGLTLCKKRVPVLPDMESLVNVASSASRTKRLLPVELPDAAGGGAVGTDPSA